jgi:hypothetical protein
MTQKPVEEPKSLWGRPWTRGADVMATWKRFGFRPPTEYRNDWLFKANREAGQKN